MSLPIWAQNFNTRQFVRQSVFINWLTGLAESFNIKNCSFCSSSKQYQIHIILSELTAIIIVYHYINDDEGFLLWHWSGVDVSTSHAIRYTSTSNDIQTDCLNSRLGCYEWYHVTPDLKIEHVVKSCHSEWWLAHDYICNGINRPFTGM